jgi:hypothetical protein
MTKETENLIRDHLSRIVNLVDNPHWNTEMNTQIIDPEKFMVIGPGYWGRGDSLKEALRRARQAGMTKKDKAMAYAGSDDLALENGFVVATQLIRLGQIQ